MSSPLIFLVSSRRFDGRRGAALVIVLTFVVLVTGLILAFFSRAIAERQISNSSANETKVDLFAQGAIDAIIGDLRQEIAAGSTSYTGADGVTIYVPTTPVTAVPALALTGTSGTAGSSFAPNLLKRSAYSQPFFSGAPNYNLSNNTVPAAGPGSATTVAYTAPNRAAQSPTTSPSQNGRFVSLARWNKPLLLPKATVTSASDFTPATAAPNAFVAPDWILVARDGINPAITNLTGANSQYLANGTNPVTSRYAYVIYDEGGLLDINVAGYPGIMATDNSTKLQTHDKGSLALADLTVLTDSSPVPKQVLTQAQIDALVGWRNYASSQAPGAFPAPAFNSASVLNYYNFVSKDTSGFLTANAFYNKQSDRRFTSRQQLIKLLSAIGSLGSNTLANTQSSLQYLGTFSRDLEQPSFNPEPNLTILPLTTDPKGRPKNTKYMPAGDGGNDAYSTDGSLQAKINPPLLTVRNAVGKPVMLRRFPLSRLGLLEQAAQTLRSGGTLSATQQNQIYDYFGLTWNVATPTIQEHWEYNHGGGAKVIYSLVDLATPPAAAANPDGTAREPDFFETLRAVIICDSLGKQHGSLDMAKTPHSTVTGSSLIDGFVNYQIFQIGANLIDQYDADSYPTSIFSDTWEIYGVENLPRLAGWELMWYHTKNLLQGTDINTTVLTPPAASAGTTHETVAMLQPIIWNPHVADPAISPPTDFRVIACSSTDTTLQLHPIVTNEWWTGGGGSGKPPYVPATAAYASTNAMITKPGSLWQFPEATLDPSISTITFSTGTGTADFREPYRLHALNDPPNSNAKNDGLYSDGLQNVGADTALVQADGGATSVIGFFVGKCWTGPSMDHTNTANWLSKGSLNRDPKFKLQYRNPSTASGSSPWLTYDEIADVFNVSSTTSTVDNADTPPYIRGFMTGWRVDPRTDRWGLYRMRTFPTTDSTNLPNGLVQPFPSGNGVTTDKNLYYFPQATTSKPKETSTYIMGINDGYGGPLAGGWAYSSTPVKFVPSDLMANLGPTPNVNTASGGTTDARPGAKNYYTDPDTVLRRASGGNFSGDDGLPLYTGNTASRPIILNRPFRSIAEMGYAFRGVAWRDIEFFAPESGDAGLLDAFCLNELDNAPNNVTVAGRINLNTRQVPVLQALISGVSKADGETLSASEAKKAAQALVDWTSDVTSNTSGILNKGPLRNRSELVGKFVYQVAFNPPVTWTSPQGTNGFDPAKTYQGYSSVLTSATGGVFSSTKDAAIKRRRECVLRALSDAGNARVWNLLIDVVAQTGIYPSGTSDLAKFSVQGETRYWVHLAIDRCTGEVIAKQIEQVSE